jgi:hypothetical protein
LSGRQCAPTPPVTADLSFSTGDPAIGDVNHLPDVTSNDTGIKNP